MATTAKPIPAGYDAPTPYLCVAGAAEAIEFYRKAFGAEELMRVTQPDGRVGHAEMRIGGGLIMLSDEYPDMGVRSPKALGGSPVTIHFYVDDVDATVSRATAAGARVVRAVQDQFYGDRAGKIEDPFGHQWWIATHKEDVPPDELKRRLAKLFGAA